MPSLRALFVLYRSRRRAMATACLLWLASALFQIAALGSLYLVVASILVAAGDGTPATSMPALQYLQSAMPGVDPVIASLTLYLVADSLYLIVFFLQRIVTQATSIRIRSDYNQRLFDKYLDADFQFMLDRRHGEVVFRVLGAPVQLGEIAVALPQMLAQALTLAGVLALMLLASTLMTMSLITLSIVMLGGYEAVARVWMYDGGRAKVRIRQQQNVLLAELLDGIKQFKVYGHLPRWAAAFQSTCDEYASLLSKLLAVAALPPYVLRIVSVATLVVAASVVIQFFPDRLATWLPLITLYFVAVQRLLPTVAGVAQMRARLVENMPTLELISKELAEPSEIVGGGVLSPPPIGSGIAFEHVGLVYPGRPQVLRDVSLVFGAGLSTGIVGPSGSGKSSMLNLLARLYDPSEGVIRVGGVDLTSLDTKKWRRSIGFVSQESFLYYATVAENISFGRAASHDEIHSAAVLALADEFIRELPDGYNTVVGEQGLKLSGGQRQRIGIARAILKVPSIVIFDEATNSLDAVSELAVQASIAQVSVGRTAIVVAHRLASVRSADHIIVLDRGAVVEEGTHDELLLGRGLYHHLYHQDPISSGDVDAAVVSPA